jgi:hypothetical protein
VIEKRINNIVSCNPIYFEAKGENGNNQIRNIISFTYTVLPLHFLQSESNNLPTHDKIIIYDKEDFAPSLYKYQYNLDGTWVDISSDFYNADKLIVSTRDLLGEDCMKHIGKNISFRATSCYSDDSYSDSKTFKIMPSAPHIENVRYEMPTCHGDEDGKLIIKFDRALYRDGCGIIPQPDNSMCERLYISVDGNRYTEPDIIKTQIIDPTTLEYTIENLAADTYNLDILGVVYYKRPYYVVDSIYTYTMGNRHRDTVEIPERPALKLESISADSVHCNGGADGKIHIKISGGVGIFNAYLKSNSGDYTDTVRNFLSNTNATFFNLPAGIYTVKVADTNGCTKDENGDDIISIIEVKQPANPVAINGNYAWEEPKCFGNSDGWAQIYFDGGTKPYTVVWKDSTGAIIPNTISPYGNIYSSKVENIRAGKYFITVRDAHYSQATPAVERNLCGCYDTMTIIITEPPILEVAIEESHYVTCYGDNDGVIVAHGTGGRPFVSGNPYKYEWSKIVNGISSAIGTNDSILDNLYYGLYAVKMTDRNSICIARDTFYLPQPDTLVVKTKVLQNVLCNGENTGVIITKVTGGTPPYTYIWSNGETTPEIHNLSMGGYVVYVRDARYADNGITGHYCFAQDQAFITSPNGIEFNAAITHPVCSGYSDGSIILNVTGGVAPYSYLWENGSSESSRTELPAGVYSVSVTDDNGCIISQTYTLNDPDPITVNLGKDITLCKNQTVIINGSINRSNVSYEWTDEHRTTVLSTSAEYELTGAGIYRLTATTAEGCFGSDEIVVSQSDDEIDVDFVIATTVANNTQLYAVNITRLSLDYTEWIIPDDAILLEHTDDRIQILFPRNGTYIIGLKGYKGLCEKTLYKTISVVDRSEIIEDESSEPFLKKFIVAPNPNDGNFNVIIELREAAEFRLILYDMSGSVVEMTPTYNAASQIISFSRSTVSAGTYLLKFVSGKTTSVFKILIQ